MKKILLILFTVTISIAGCNDKIDIHNTKWQSIDTLACVEFQDSLCLFVNTSRYTGHKDSILTEYSYIRDTITFIPLQDHITFDSRFLVTDSGMVNLNRGVVVAKQIK